MKLALGWLQLVAYLFAAVASSEWIPPKPVTSHGNYLLQGQFISPNSQLVSLDGLTKLVLSLDGTASVLHDGVEVWSEGGEGWEQLALSLSTGTMELRASERQTLQFKTGYMNLTDKKFPNRLDVENGGNVAIYDLFAMKRWDTNTTKREYTAEEDSTTPIDWTLPSDYVPAPESWTGTIDRSRCPVTSRDIPGLDFKAYPLSSFKLCPPCTYVTKLELTVKCTISGVVSFTCSDGTVVPVNVGGFYGDNVRVVSRSGFSQVSAGNIPDSIYYGLVHVNFTSAQKPDTSIFPSPALEPIEVANPRRLRPSTGMPACVPDELLERPGTPEQFIRDEYDVMRVTCGPRSKIVGVRASLRTSAPLDEIEFSVVCGITDPAPLPVEENPCESRPASNMAWYNTDTKKCYEDVCPRTTSLYTCGLDPEVAYCLRNVGILCEVPYVMFDDNDRPFAFPCDQPFPCEETGLCKSFAQCFPVSYGVIRECDYSPPPIVQAPTKTLEVSQTNTLYLDNYLDWFIQIGPKAHAFPSPPPPYYGSPSPPVYGDGSMEAEEEDDMSEDIL